MSDRDIEYARQKVAVVAWFVIVASSITILFMLFSLVTDVILLVSGAAEYIRAERALRISPETYIAIRCTVAFVFQSSNTVVLLGAIAMKNLRNWNLVFLTNILCYIPCLTPCYCPGIILAIWMSVVLNDPRVRRAFSR